MPFCRVHDEAHVCVLEAGHEGPHDIRRVHLSPRPEAPAPGGYSCTDRERFTLVAAAMRRAGQPDVAVAIERERDAGPPELSAAEGARTPPAAEANPAETRS